MVPRRCCVCRLCGIRCLMMKSPCFFYTLKMYWHNCNLCENVFLISTNFDVLTMYYPCPVRLTKFYDDPFSRSPPIQQDYFALRTNSTSELNLVIWHKNLRCLVKLLLQVCSYISEISTIFWTYLVKLKSPTVFAPVSKGMTLFIVNSIHHRLLLYLFFSLFSPARV